MYSELKIDEIGYWSEIKLSILEEYAKPYNQILLSKHLHPIYIDAFAGAGHHKAKDSDRLIDGSPTRAMGVEPPFEFLHFIDSDIERVKRLKNWLREGRTSRSITETVTRFSLKKYFQLSAMRIASARSAF